MPSGGKRAGSGRKPLPKSKKRAMVSVKILPAANRVWKQMANSHNLSKGKLVEKFLGFDPNPGTED